MAGYGNTAPYGDLYYKGEIYKRESYTDVVALAMIYQYRKPYGNIATTTTTETVEQSVIVSSYEDGAELSMLSQYRKGCING